MFRFRAGLMMLAVLIPLLAFAAPKARDWQKGKVIESERTRDEKENITETATIEGITHVYTAQKRPHLRERYPNLTVNALVKFAVEKRNLFVIDDDGREHKLEITRQALKEPAQPK